MESFFYSLKAKSFKLLQENELPQEIINSLKTLKDNKYETKTHFIEKLKEILGDESMDKYKDIILKYTEIAGKFNGSSYIEFLQQLLNKYGGNIILIEDGASYHKRADVTEFKKNSARLSVYRLPSFSPDYNPIEKLWKNTKQNATHLKYFKTFEELRNSVVNTFQRYMKDASKVICVMKKLRENSGLDIK